MTGRLHILQDLRVATPCPASWENMRGDDKRRYCGLCEKNVYNIAAMDPEEAVNLIFASEGQLCVRLYMRQDGTALTRDCPVGVRARLRAARRWAWARASAFAALLLGGLSWFGHGNECSGPTDGTHPPRRAPGAIAGGLAPLDLDRHPVEMGEMAPPPPRPDPTAPAERPLPDDQFSETHPYP